MKPWESVKEIQSLYVVGLIWNTRKIWVKWDFIVILLYLFIL